MLASPRKMGGVGALTGHKTSFDAGLFSHYASAFTLLLKLSQAKVYTTYIQGF